MTTTTMTSWSQSDTGRVCVKLIAGFRPPPILPADAGAPRGAEQSLRFAASCPPPPPLVVALLRPRPACPSVPQPLQCLVDRWSRHRRSCIFSKPFHISTASRNLKPERDATTWRDREPACTAAQPGLPSLTAPVQLPRYRLCGIALSASGGLRSEKRRKPSLLDRETKLPRHDPGSGQLAFRSDKSSTSAFN